MCHARYGLSTDGKLTSGVADDFCVVDGVELPAPFVPEAATFKAMYPKRFSAPHRSPGYPGHEKSHSLVETVEAGI